MSKFLPISFFILLVALLGFGLFNDPKFVPSPFIGKAAPAFDTTRLYSSDRISVNKMKGRVWVLNVFASWCVSCRAEHQLITQLAKGVTPVIGLNYKDESVNAKAWLKQFGNPYSVVAVDLDGHIGIDWGVYGVPESFIVDKKGIIRYKQTGPITQETLSKEIIPLIAQLEKEE